MKAMFEEDETISTEKNDEVVKLKAEPLKEDESPKEIKALRNQVEEMYALLKEMNLNE